MKLHDDLLEQADHLTRRETRRPRQASLRRATSASYYAVFHLLCFEAAVVLAPDANAATRAKLQRLLGHAEMKIACGRFLQQPVSTSVSQLIGKQVSDDLRLVALTFTQLQEARHSADYDLNSEWNRTIAIQHVKMAQDAFAAWARIRKETEANIFLLSFLLLKQIDTLR